MASFMVLEPPRTVSPERTAYVRDGFHVIAFLVPVLWLLRYRLWIEAVLLFAVFGALTAAATLLGHGMVASWLGLLLSVWIGLEAGPIRTAALTRRGWRARGIVEAGNLEDAETRYLFETADEREQAEKPIPLRPALGAPRPSGPALGMLDYPRGL